MSVHTPLQTSPPSDAPSSMVERVKRQLVEAITSESRDAGKPLPSQRAWAKRFGVSNFTISKAMGLLKDEGLIEAREGSYTYLRQAAPVIKQSRQPRQRAATELHIWIDARRSIPKLKSAIAHRTFNKRFAQRHRGVIVCEREIEGSSEENVSRLLLNLCSGEPEPTIFSLSRTYLRLLQQHHAVASIEDWTVDRDSLARYLDSLKEPYREICREPAIAGSTQTNGAMYLPTSVTHSHLIYNRQLFAEAGIGADSPPADWAEFEDQLQQLKRAFPDRAPFWLTGRVSAAYWLADLVYGSMDDLSETGHLPVIDWQSPAATVAIEKFIDWSVRQQLVAFDQGSTSDLASACLANEVAMTIGGTSVAEAIAALGEGERFGIAPLPAGPNGQRFSQRNVIGRFINAHASDQAKQAGAAHTLEREQWLRSAPGARQLSNLGLWPAADTITSEAAGNNLHVPSAWVGPLKQIAEQGRWEPADADFQKSLIAPILRSLLIRQQSTTAARLQQQLSLRASSMPAIGELN